METTMANRFVSLVTFLGLMAAGSMTANQAATSNTAEASQAESKAPAFEVAAIKPSEPMARYNGCFMKGQPGGQTFVGRCITARLLITYSYKIIDSQLVGGPDWLDTQLYDFGTQQVSRSLWELTQARFGRHLTARRPAFPKSYFSPDCCSPALPASALPTMPA